MFRSSEQKHFSTLIARHIEAGDGPLLLEGGTGLGKTRACLAALAGRRERVAIVLPTHQLIRQLLDSADLAAVGLDVAYFRPARTFETRAEYDACRRRAMASRVMCCTAASVMIDQRLKGGYNGASRRDYLLFDEADQLPQAAALQQDLTVSAAELKVAGVALTTVGETVAALLAGEGIEPEVRARAMIVREALAAPARFRKVGKDDAGGIALWHPLPGRLLKRLSNRGHVAFVSATLTVEAGAQNFDDFRHRMGIEAKPSRFSRAVEPENHGQLRVEAPLVDDGDPAKVAEVVAAAERPCLVVTPSFEDAGALAAHLPGAVVREMPEAEDRRETASEAAARVAEDGILIAAGAWAGLDVPLRWRSIVVPRIPFERPAILDGEIESSFFDNRNAATRRMRQVVGRGLRTPDARCTLYLCDKRHETLGRFLPQRFQDGWAEGGRRDLALSRVERCPAVRRAALKRHGCHCHACGYVPPNGHARAIDVHHLHPLAEGARKTRIEDVIPLCANCHRLAHGETPPIPLDRLRRLAGEARWTDGGGPA